MAELERAMLHWRQLLDEGSRRRDILSGVSEGRLVRVARGCYLERALWQRLRSEERQLVAALACERNHRGCAPLFSHYTAAALWGLPLYRFGDTRAHTLQQPGTRAGSTTGVVRHCGAYDAADTVEICGLRVTSLTRTVVDLARVAAPELALGCADAGLSLLHGNDADGAERWRRQQLEALGELSGHRGVRSAGRVIAFADGRADSVLESVSRLQLARLGFRIAFQVPVRTPGGEFRVDFEFLDHDALGEVDGEVKYTDPAMRGGRSLERVIVDEKIREDLVRGVTGKRVVRWDARAAATVQALGARLRAFGLVPGARPRPSPRPR